MYFLRCQNTSKVLDSYLIFSLNSVEDVKVEILVRPVEIIKMKTSNKIIESCYFVFFILQDI